MDILLLSILLSLAPISELRGAIPLAITSGTNPLVAFLVCVASNLLVAPFVFFLLDKIYFLIFRKTLKEHGIIQKLKKKSLEKNFNRYGFFALTIFVAIPFPLTGAWSGSLIAWVLGFDEKKAIAAVSIGVVIAGVIVTLISLGIIGFLLFLL
ncbi:MAG: small multi-drug export protein [Candidatus Pacearchaeota archaeon]